MSRAPPAHRRGQRWRRGRHRPCRRAATDGVGLEGALHGRAEPSEVAVAGELPELHPAAGVVAGSSCSGTSTLGGPRAPGWWVRARRNSPVIVTGRSCLQCAGPAPQGQQEGARVVGDHRTGLAVGGGVQVGWVMRRSVAMRSASRPAETRHHRAIQHGLRPGAGGTASPPRVGGLPAPVPRRPRDRGGAVVCAARRADRAAPAPRWGCAVGRGPHRSVGYGTRRPPPHPAARVVPPAGAWRARGRCRSRAPHGTVDQPVSARSGCSPRCRSCPPRRWR